MPPKKDSKPPPQQEQQQQIPKEFLLDRKCEACCEVALKRIVYSSFGGLLASFILFRNPSSRWSAIAFSTGLGFGSAYTDCSHLMEGIPKWPVPQQLVREIKKCSRDLMRCKTVHAEVLRSEHSQDRYLANLLIDAYGKCGSVQDARAVFDRIVQKNVFSWNMILAAYAQNGQHRQASIVFQRQPERDGVSWNTVLQAFTECGELGRAMEIFVAMPQRDMVSWNTLLQADHTQDHAHSEMVFRRSPCHNLRSTTAFIVILSENRKFEEAKAQFDLMPERDVIAWTSMIHSCAMNQDLQQGVEGFAKIPERTSFCWNVMIKLYADAGLFKECREAFNSIPERSQVSWTTMLTAYGQKGDLDRCKSLFDSMPDRNIIAWTAMLDAFSQNGVLQQAAKLFSKLPQRDQISFTSILSAYARCGHSQEARKIYEEMPSPCVASLNALIQGYAQTEHMRDAEEMLWLGSLQGLDLNEKTFIGVLAGYSYGGKLNEGRASFASMIRDFQLKPWIEHYCCIVHLLGRADRPGDAQDLIKNMPFSASGVEWTSLLDSCRIQGNAAWAEIAAENALRAQPQHGGSYVLLQELRSTQADPVESKHCCC